jgi:hypothetical protein
MSPPVARGGAPRGGAPRALALALALCAIASVGAFDVEGGGVAGARPQMPRAAVAGAPAAQQEGLVAKVGKWGRAYQGFVAGAAKVSRWINFGTGCWLVLSTPLTVLASGLTLRPAEAVLICYLGFFGVMMAGQNVPLGGMQRIFQTYFRFLYTELGRVGFFTLVLAIAWSCAQVSVITRLLAAFNALLAFYLFNARSASASVAEAGDMAKQAAEELRGKASGVLGMANMLGVGNMFKGDGGGGGGGGTQPPPAAGGGYPAGGAAPAAAAPAAAAPSAAPPAAGGEQQAAWPSGDD